jgi:hypothetical protein
MSILCLQSDSPGACCPIASRSFPVKSDAAFGLFEPESESAENMPGQARSQASASAIGSVAIADASGSVTH